MKNFYLLICLVAISINTVAQKVGIGTSTPNASAILDVNSTNKGMLLPRMTTAQRKAIVAPTQGLLVYDLEKLTIFMYDGVKWLPMLFAANENSILPTTRQATDGAAADAFGYSVSISGDYAIAGLKPNVNRAGAAYIFFRNGGVWQQQAKLVAGDGFTNDGFGISVCISGSEAIVGSSRGAAYIFSRNGTAWAQLSKLSPNDGFADDNFGFSVSINGNYAIVGAPLADVLGGYSNQGSAYIFFKGAGWAPGQTQQAKLLAPDGAQDDNFGHAVSINGDYVIVGAPSDDAEFVNQGAAYVFGRLGANWPNLAKLKGELGANRWFGASVCINGDYAVIGSPYENAPPYDVNVKGSAYIFYGGSGWSTGQAFQAGFSSSNPYNGVNDRFGYSVSISGDYAIVGAYAYNSPGNIGSGNASVYKRDGTTWVLLNRIDDGSAENAGGFGTSVAISGFSVVIGAPGKNAARGELAFLNVE